MVCKCVHLEPEKGISVSLDYGVILNTLARTVAWLEGYSLNIAHGSSVSEVNWTIDVSVNKVNWTIDVSVLSMAVKDILFSITSEVVLEPTWFQYTESFKPMFTHSGLGVVQSSLRPVIISILWYFLQSSRNLPRRNFSNEFRLNCYISVFPYL
jgi:hypothetical protein